MSLEGCRIVVPETRALDLFASMLERQGATTIRCPLVGIRDVEDPAPVEAWLRRLAEGAFDDVVFFTGEGVTRLLDFAERAGIRADVVAALHRVRKVVRGPKPIAALRRAGLGPDLSAAVPTTAGLIETLDALALRDRRMGIQLYPEAPDTLAAFLRSRGALCDIVLCYRYASEEEDARVVEMIRRMAAGEVDLIAFTSTPQIRRLRTVAEAAGLESLLQAAMAATRIAAVGPVTAAAVENAGWRAAALPASSFHLKPFVAEIVGLLGRGAR